MEGVSGWLLTQGPLGVGVVLALVVVGRLWTRLEALQGRIDALQEQRVTDAKSYGERMERLALSSTQAVRKLYRALGEKDTGADQE